MDSQPDQWAAVLRGAVRPMQEMQAVLKEAGLRAEVVSPDGQAGKG